MGTIDDWKKKTADAAKAVAEEAAKEFAEKVEPILVEKGFDLRNVVEVKTTLGDAHYIVFRIPKPAEFQRLRHTMFGDKSERGVTERKSKAGAQLALDCTIYPELEAYKALVDKYPGIEDAVGQAAYAAAEAAAEVLEKS